jgi:hypothetical protein
LATLTQATAAAIDPGMSGGIALLLPDNSILLHPMPEDMAELANLIPFGCTIYLEKVPPFVGRIIPSSAAFKLGKSCGWIEGWCIGRQHRVILVSPQTWQAGLGITKAGSPNWKSALKAEASRRFPWVDGLTLKTADALLILDHSLNLSPRK